MVVDPLGEVADLQVAIDAIEFDEANPMVAVMTLMTNKIPSTTIQQVTFKKQNSLLMAARVFKPVDKPLVPVNFGRHGRRGRCCCYLL